MARSTIAATALLALLAPWCHSELSAQGTAEDYRRAASLRARYRGKVVRFPTEVRWLDGGAALWFRQQGKDGETVFVHVDCATGKRRQAASLAELEVPGVAGDGSLPPLRGVWRRRAARRRNARR